MLLNGSQWFVIGSATLRRSSNTALGGRVCWNESGFRKCSQLTVVVNLEIGNFGSRRIEFWTTHF